jgi:sugar lactone lactonase YvrE
MTFRSRLTLGLRAFALGALLLSPLSADAQSATMTDRLTLLQSPTAQTSPTQAIFATAQGPIFAQLTAGGLMRSDDAAQTWHTEPLPALPDQAELRLATLDSSGHSVAYARVPRATKPNPSAFGPRSIQLYTLLRAHSGDPTWTPIQPPADPLAEVQTASSANPDVVYATTDAAEGGNYTFHLWRSLDAGATWDDVYQQKVYGTCSMLLQPHPSDARRVFSPGLICITGSQGSGAPVRPRYQESRDQGATWTDFFSVDKLVDPPFPQTAFYGRVTQMVGGMPPVANAFLAEITYDERAPGPGMGLYRSLDDGQTWSSVLQATQWDQGLHPGAIRQPSPTLGTAALDPRTPDGLLVTDGRLSEDGGKTWTGSPPVDAAVHVAAAPSGLLAATPSGVVRLQLAHQTVTLPDQWQVLGAGFNQPSAISFAPDGTLLVGDRGRVQRLSLDGQVLQQMSGRLDVPIDALAQDDQGAIYLAERSPHVDVITPDGTFSTLIDLVGQYAGGVALDGAGNAYTTQRPDIIPRDNPPQAVVGVALADGSVQATWGPAGHDPGQFGAVAWSVALDANGNIYVADTANNRIQSFAADGTLLNIWDGLHGPTGIALDAAGNLYAADTDANRIVELAPDGTPLGSWGGWGSALGQFWQPQGIAVDPGGSTLYVADTFNNRVIRIDLVGMNIAN